ncbi:MAG: glycosyltransferase family 39 protein [Acidobacteriota bacterium]
MPSLSPGAGGAEPGHGRRWWRWLALAAVCYLLYFSGLSAVGLLGPDEPRYAAIGREMARSGDWITPRLWGEPWFEKPPLLYWMTALAFRLGLGDDLAPRLPVALVSVAFLVFFYRTLRREFGEPAAWYATAVLGTSAGWLAFSRVGVTDLPMSAAFSAAMLLMLPWIARGERRGLAAAALLLGLAVLAKGLVPLALALPAVWLGRRRLGDWIRPAPVAAFLLAALPWYALMTARHGSAFLSEFFLVHHFGRVYTEALRHMQPFWFYLPVFVAGLFPWTPLLGLLFRRKLYQDARARLFLLWLAFGIVFFSLSLNKLPGYLLPLLPAVSALAGLGLAEARGTRWLLAAAGVLLAAIPVAIDALPGALARGLTRAQPGGVSWPFLAAALLAAAWCWWQAERRRRWAVAAVVAGMCAGVVSLQVRAYPLLDRGVSVRAFWRENPGVAREACLEGVDRDRRYGLNYYSRQPLAECAVAPRPLRIRETPAGRLYIAE